MWPDQAFHHGVRTFLKGHCIFTRFCFNFRICIIITSAIWKGRGQISLKFADILSGWSHTFMNMGQKECDVLFHPDSCTRLKYLIHSHIPYTCHYKPRLAYLLAHILVYKQERSISKTIYVVNKEILQKNAQFKIKSRFTVHFIL